MAIHNIVLVSGGQHSDSVIRTVFQVPFGYRFYKILEWEFTMPNMIGPVSYLFWHGCVNPISYNFSLSQILFH